MGEFAGKIYFGAAGLLFVEVSRLCYTIKPKDLHSPTHQETSSAVSMTQPTNKVNYRLSTRKFSNSALMDCLGFRV